MIVEDFLRYMLAERDASPRTVDTYRDALNDFQAFLSKLDNQMTPEGADSDVIRDWIEDMMERGLKASYACKRLSAVKSLYRYALRKGIVERDPAHKVTGPKKEKVLPTFLREEEANDLFDRLEWNLEDIKDVRARTLLLLLYSTGIRSAEVVGLTDDNVNLITREIKVTGKRRKQRIVPLGDEMVEAIKSYQQQRDEKTPATDNIQGRQRESDNLQYGLPHRKELSLPCYYSEKTLSTRTKAHIRHSDAQSRCKTGKRAETAGS